MGPHNGLWAPPHSFDFRSLRWTEDVTDWGNTVCQPKSRQSFHLLPHASWFGSYDTRICISVACRVEQRGKGLTAWFQNPSTTDGSSFGHEGNSSVQLGMRDIGLSL